MKKLNVAKKSPSRFSINRQSGAVLVVSLVILAVVSLIAISGMETTSTEVQMANNFYERELALQAAEAGLRQGETWLEAQATAPEPGVDKVSNFGDISELIDDSDSSMWNYDTFTTAVVLPADGPDVQTRYFIERRALLGNTIKVAEKSKQTIDAADAPNVYYRITARGVGRNGESMVYLQSHYLR